MGEVITCCHEKDRTVIESSTEKQKVNQVPFEEKQEDAKEPEQNELKKKKLQKVDLFQSEIKTKSDAELIRSFKSNWQNMDHTLKQNKMMTLNYKESKTLNEAQKSFKDQNQDSLIVTHYNQVQKYSV